MANFYLAFEAQLSIIPVINKVIKFLAFSVKYLGCLNVYSADQKCNLEEKYITKRKLFIIIFIGFRYNITRM